MYMYMFESHLRQLIFLGKNDCLGCAVLLCLVVCLTLLASFIHSLLLTLAFPPLPPLPPLPHLTTRVRSILGVTYVAIKVGMILAVEAGVFPLMCGWWIDICAFVSELHVHVHVVTVSTACGVERVPTVMNCMYMYMCDCMTILLYYKHVHIHVHVTCTCTFTRKLK